MAYIRRVKTNSGAIAVQVAYKVHGKVIRINHIGSAHDEEGLARLEALAEQQLPQAAQRSLFADDSANNNSLSGVFIRRTKSQLLYDTLSSLYCQLGLDSLADEDFKRLCIARMVEPTSKLDSLRVLTELGQDSSNEDRLYRCLKRVVAEDYRAKLAKLCFAHASGGSGITLVLYDVTTLYFEIQKEDEDDGSNFGYRKPGMSKERRLEPQIIVGLLVDQNGFPLELHSFEGNKAETKTIVPVVEDFKRRHGIGGITVVADAGMLSASNLAALHEAGHTYIVGSRMNKIPYDIAEYQKADESGKERTLTDDQVIVSSTDIPGQRVIYQYRAKRAALDLRNIEKRIEKANKIIEGKTTAKKAKFLTVKTEGKQTKGLDRKLIDKAKALAGIKGYVTNLSEAEASSEQVIGYYHQLWRVEQSFRMSKSDLKARPIFHHQKDAIEAHLTVVMAALAIGRIIEQRTELTIKRFVKLLRPIRSGTVVIGGKEYPAEAEVPADIRSILDKLDFGALI